MNKLFFSFILVIAYGIISQHQDERHSPKMPLYIAYQKHIPDSLEAFTKLYFQSKKIEVITMKEMIELWGNKITEEMKSVIAANKFNEATARSLPESIPPVSNVLGIKIFNDTTNVNEFITDSIHWYVRYHASDPKTKPVNRLFIPSPELKANASLVMKSLADTVLASKLLK